MHWRPQPEKLPRAASFRTVNAATEPPYSLSTAFSDAPTTIEPSNGQSSNVPTDLTQQGVSVAFTASRGLAEGCAAPGCGITLWSDLSRCMGCKAALYCGKEHQHEHRPEHKAACSKIKKSNLEYQEAERKLREEEGDDIFEDGPPHFWSIHKSRPYMQARFALVEACLLVNTVEAVDAALGHLLEMLQLCRNDNMGLRDLVPALYLRLHRDQEAYDYCKWWVTRAQEEEHDWGNKANRFLDIRGADPFEDPKYFVHEATVSLSFAVSVALTKIRLLLDLRALMRDGEKAAPKLPSEVSDQALVHCTSSIIKSQRHMLERDDQTINITAQRRHIRQLFDAVKDSNKYFWPALVDPGSNLDARATMHGFGDTGQMQVVLRYNYSAWAETEGAIGVIEELLEDPVAITTLGNCRNLLCSIHRQSSQVHSSFSCNG